MYRIIYFKIKVVHKLWCPLSNHYTKQQHEDNPIVDLKKADLSVWSLFTPDVEVLHTSGDCAALITLLT